VVERAYVSHWLSKVIELLQVETADLRELARLAGGNPKTFYRGARLDGVDLRGQDLRGMQFTELGATNLLVDEGTRVDRRYLGAIRPEDTRNKREKEGSESLDPEWAKNWFQKWAKVHSLAARKLVSDEGEAELRLHTVNNDDWPRVWQAIWLPERRTSPRRTRLAELAFDKIGSLNGAVSLNWLVIFRRLWNRASPGEQDMIAHYVQATAESLMSYDSEDWYQKWSELLRVDKVALVVAGSLYDTAFNWLNVQSINHPNWAAVWRRLWSIDPFRRDALARMGLGWLGRVDARVGGWPIVWRRLWNHSHVTLEKKQELVRMVEWWLENHPKADGWIYVWRDLSRDPEASKSSWFSKSALEWLEGHKQHGEWLLVWRTVFGSQYAQKEQLNSIALEWLRGQSKSEHWPKVWLEVWNLSDQRASAELVLLGREWLAKHKRGRLRGSIVSALFRLNENEGEAAAGH
jgi:hypothetical protein